MFCHRNFNHSRYIPSNKLKILGGSKIEQLTYFSIGVLFIKIAEYLSLDIFGQLSVIITNANTSFFNI